MEYFFVGLLSFVVFWVVFLWARKQDAQTTWVYCPGCKHELVGGTQRHVLDTDAVRYYCMCCLTVSVWDFDAPVPILLDAYYLDPNDWPITNGTLPPPTEGGAGT